MITNCSQMSVVWALFRWSSYNVFWLVFRCRRRWIRTSRCCVANLSCLMTTAHYERLRTTNVPNHSWQLPKSRDNSSAAALALWFVSVSCSASWLSSLAVPAGCYFGLSFQAEGETLSGNFSAISAFGFWLLIAAFPIGNYDAGVSNCSYIFWHRWWHIPCSGPSVFNFRCANFIFIFTDYIFNSAIYRVIEVCLAITWNAEFGNLELAA